MNIEYTLLGRLSRVPSSGYDLGRWLKTEGRYYGFRDSLTPIYRALSLLEKRGSISHRIEPSVNAPDAKVYYLTAIGRQALIDWANSPYVPSQRPMDPDFAQRFLWAGQFGRDIAIRILRTELHFRLAQRAQDQQIVRTAASVDAIPEIDLAWAERLQQLGHERGYLSTSLFISWLEMTLMKLEREETAELALHQSNPIHETKTL